jgi:hypothetical protein
MMELMGPEGEDGWLSPVGQGAIGASGPVWIMGP